MFDPGPCVQVVDKATQPSAQISYRVSMDDTLLTLGDIPLPDALTHQFFALRGTVLFEGFAPELRTFDPSAPDAVVLPLWISQRDVTRAQDSSNTHTLGYDFSPITPEDVLDTKRTMTGRWLRITSDDRRVPISSDQALAGVKWNVSDVEPGLYTIAAYIFSPPYNGWEVREGLISVVDSGHETPAAVVGRIQESLFAGQGRKVSTCLDVPAGTRMRSYLRFEEREDLDWMEWDEDRPVESGSVEQCLHPPEGLTGTVRLRVDLTAPDGSTTAFYSPDTLSLIEGSLPCRDSISICCAPAEPMQLDAAVTDAASTPATQPRQVSDAGGCSIVLGPQRNAFASRTTMLILLTLIARRRRPRRSSG